ncbi:MAG: hypothetical protein FWH19_00930 [Treponema sp.]|nr:hypothetical protein [Treponema sp.]
MKKLLLFALLGALAMGMMFVACDSNGGGDVPPAATNTESYAFRGLDSQGRTVEVVISRPAPARIFTPADNDNYTISLDGQVISQGTIRVDGNVVHFFPGNGGGSSFRGTIIDWHMSIPSIPYSGGTVSGFKMEAGVGSGGGGGGGGSGSGSPGVNGGPGPIGPGGDGPSTFSYYISTQDGDDSNATTILTVVFDRPLVLTADSVSFLTTYENKPVFGRATVVDVTPATTSPGRTWDIEVAVTAPGMGMMRVVNTQTHNFPTPVPLFDGNGFIEFDTITPTVVNGTTTAIVIEFDTPITDLTMDEIVISGGTGRVEKKSLAVDITGDEWTLTVTTSIAGSIQFYVNRADVDPRPQTVPVVKGPNTLTMTGFSGVTVAAGAATTVTLTFGGANAALFEGTRAIRVQIPSAARAPGGTYGTITPSGGSAITMNETFVTTGVNVNVPFNSSGVGTLSIVLNGAATHVAGAFSFEAQGFALERIIGLSDGPITVNPLTVAHSAAVTRDPVLPSRGTAGADHVFTTQPVITVRDEYGNLVGGTANVTMTINPAVTNLSVIGGGVATVALSSGLATFTAAGLVPAAGLANPAGSITLRFTEAGGGTVYAEHTFSSW